MDRDEAKNILQLCRPGNESDRNDPLIAEAIAMLDNDAELRAWFDEQQAFDADICEQMQRVEPPADLKASILAGMRAHQMEVEPTVAEFEGMQQQVDTVISQTNSAWWRNPWVGVAALFVFMLAIINAPSRNDTQVAQDDPALSGLPPILPFLSDQIDGMNIFSFDKKDDNAHQLQSYLASTGAPSPKNLCEQLAGTPTIGCVTFDYNGTKLSMICFKDGDIYHLITAEAADFPEACPKSPEVYEINDKAFKVWVEDDQLNILTIHGTKNDIPEFI
ncbi:MAG: hypothetical protein ACN4GF_04165 [Lentimonas sp.]